ncbi:MAG: RNA methyltransferase [Pseudomonadota bacterium]
MAAGGEARTNKSGRKPAQPAGKPAWAIARDRAKREGPTTVWLFGLHAVRAALENPARRRHRLILTPNAVDRLGPAVAAAGVTPEIADPRRFSAPLDPGSVHQGAALEADPLEWPSLSELCAPRANAPDANSPRIVLLDRVSDPHNVGAVLRSAEVFGARAVIATARHAAPETGSLAKAASGALERQPYLRVRNLATAMETLTQMGYRLTGLDGAAPTGLAEMLAAAPDQPTGLVLGAEGAGLRELTRARCTGLARIGTAAGFASLNVSNAAAIALYAAQEALAQSSGGPNLRDHSTS